MNRDLTNGTHQHDDRHAVISAFLDNEPFDAAALAEALADPDGRALLIDLVALRDLVQTDAQPAAATDVPPAGAGAPPATAARRTSWRWLAAAAALVIVTGGAYQVGSRSDDRVAATLEEAPAPTQVVKFERGVNWTEGN